MGTLSNHTKRLKFVLWPGEFDVGVEKRQREAAHEDRLGLRGWGNEDEVSNRTEWQLLPETGQRL